MSDKTEPRDLETMLARVQADWQELADLLRSQHQGQEGVIEVEKILLRDASGKYRGKISANADGSAGLLLSDHEGNAWAWLGVDQDGTAFLELKDRQGELRFTVAGGAVSPEAGAAPAASPPPDLPPEPAAQSLESLEAVPPPAMDAAAAGPPPEEPEAFEPVPSPDYEAKPRWDESLLILDRLEQLERQNRGRRWYQGLILAALGVILATLALVLVRSYLPGPLEVEALVVRGPDGSRRAQLGMAEGKVALDLWDRQGKQRLRLGLEAEDAPGFALYDQEQRKRAELSLGPDGSPRFTFLSGPLEVEALVVRGPDGSKRAELGMAEGKVALDLWDRQGKQRLRLGLGAEDAPGFALYDQEQRVRAELSLEPDGSPKFTLQDNRNLQGKTEINPPNDSGNPTTRPGVVAGSEGDTAGRPQAAGPQGQEAEVGFVGSTTSNRYHYSTCKLAKTIKPWRLITFKTTAEAHERGYRPCPVCNPPPPAP